MKKKKCKSNFIWIDPPDKGFLGGAVLNTTSQTFYVGLIF